jgi:hypothetical protein
MVGTFMVEETKEIKILNCLGWRELT